jgi:predicted kinase
MRKWMRERIQRRTKTSDEATTETKQAPLQPAYYDADKKEAVAETVIPEMAGAVETHAEVEPKSQSHHRGKAADVADDVDDEINGNRIDAVEPVLALAASAVGVGDRRPARPAAQRRRGRGGRGRVRKEGAPVQPARAVADLAAVNVPAVSASEPSEAAHHAPTPAVKPVVSKGTVVLAIGLPGSGKSSWFKRHELTPLSSDMLRAILFDDPTEQRFQDLIFSNLRSMLKARLIARRPLNYVDATNLTAHDRASWIKLAKDYGYEVQAVYFDVPLDVCLQRNAKRERKVPDDVMRRMAGKLTAPTFEEGFSKITMVRVKAKE